jgi:hypothetical protein
LLQQRTSPIRNRGDAPLPADLGPGLPEEQFAAQSIQMVKIIPDRSYQRLDAFWLYPTESKIADPELLNLPRLIPD